MNRLAKLLHLLGTAGFIGALAAELAIARLAPARARAAIETVARFVLQPALLLIALRPPYFEQRWLQARLLLLMLIAPIVWWQGPADPGPAAWSALALSASALAIAVWRPRLGQREPSLP